MGSWLSELPDDIIHRIITNHLLGDSNKTALRFSILSKELSRAVQRRPALCFEWDNDPRLKTIKEQELKYVVSTLIRYHNQSIHLETFRMSSNPKSDDHSSFDQCIQLVTTHKKGLKNLHLHMQHSYVWPQSVFQVESLVQLYLGCGTLQAESIIKWPNLKTLHLHHVWIEEKVFQNMIRGCPLLEELTILDTFPSIKRINISSSYLKKINIEYTRGLEEVTLDVPNILLFNYHGAVVPNLSMAGNSGGWISSINFQIYIDIDTSMFLKLKKFLAPINMSGTSITVSLGEEFMEFNITTHPQMSDFVSFPGNVPNLTICACSWSVPFVTFARKVLDNIFLICRPLKIILKDWHDSEFPKLLYDNLLGLTRFKGHHVGDPKFQPYLWNVTKIDVYHKYENGPEASELPKVWDDDNFLEIFNDYYYRNKNLKITLGFKLEYYWSWPLWFLFRLGTLFGQKLQ